MDADILLYHGDGLLARAIRFFDGTNYNHASLNVGNIPNVASKTIEEAEALGVITRSVDISIANYAPVIVKRLNNRPSDMSPVINKAKEFVGDRYGYEQLLLLALICSVRRIRVNTAVAKFVNKLLESAASIILTYTNGNRHALICSELVYRCYDEAVNGYNDPYTIHLKRDQTAKQLGLTSLVQANHHISDESLIAYFYGTNRQSFNFGFTNAPYVEKSNLGSTIQLGTATQTTPLIIANLEKEMEPLFIDVVDSYKKEDYSTDKSELLKLKANLDNFIGNHYQHKNGITTQNLVSSNNEILSSFIHDNANFVTPGDLFNATNLQYIGNLK